MTKKNKKATIKKLLCLVLIVSILISTFTFSGIAAEEKPAENINENIQEVPEESREIISLDLVPASLLAEKDLSYLAKLIMPGDLFFSINKSTGFANHSMIIVENSTNDLCYAQHTENSLARSVRRDIIEKYKNNNDYAWAFVVIKNGS